MKRVIIRGCEPADLPGVARLGARLVREHHAMDPERFFIFDGIERGYAEYLGGELGRKRSVVLVAAEGNKIVGYAYGCIEPRNWNLLREKCGAFHDLYVDEGARRKGVAVRLVNEMLARRHRRLLHPTGSDSADLDDRQQTDRIDRLICRAGRSASEGSASARRPRPQK